MIGRLTGTVLAEEAEGALVLDVNGVGYELTVPLGTVGRAPRSDGKLTLWVQTVVREDAFLLYGFPTEDERFAFRQIVSVSGIGPKTAIAILGQLPASELAHAIERKELARLVAVPGIGKKSAERMLLELAGKLPLGDRPLAPAGAPPKSARPKGPTGLSGKVHDALVLMGYKPAEAERAISALEAELAAENADVSVLVRKALAVLAK
jgi:Holliday junction DNA helicase RuvA